LHPAGAVGDSRKPKLSGTPPASIESAHTRQRNLPNLREENMISRLSSWFVNPRRNPLARMHRDAVASRLRKYGLRYDDLHDPYHDLDIKEALSRLPREVVDARNQRLKRAMDLSMKHQYLPDDLQAIQTPFRSYLSDMLALVKKEIAEREALGALPLYQRTIP
ncbi:unnamed protein product, partial [Urochloa humidicola]